MAGESSLVNLTGSPSTWILEHLLQREQVDPGANCHTFTINTKYFNADVNLNIVSYKDVTESSDVDHFEKTEALLLYCEGTTVCFDKAEEVWQKAKCSEPAVRLCIVDSTKELIDNVSSYIKYRCRCGEFKNHAGVYIMHFDISSHPPLRSNFFQHKD